MNNQYKIKYNWKTNSHFSVIITFSLLFSGCLAMAGMYSYGTKFVSDSYKIPKIIVAYNTDGIVPEGVEYLLIETQDGLAVFERELGGGGTLIKNHFQDEKGDHFFGGIIGGVCFEYVIPIDRTKEGYRYVHPNGSITSKKIDGIEYIASKNPDVKPVTKLIPRIK